MNNVKKIRNTKKYNNNIYNNLQKKIFITQKKRNLLMKKNGGADKRPKEKLSINTFLNALGTIGRDIGIAPGYLERNQDIIEHIKNLDKLNYSLDQICKNKNKNKNIKDCVLTLPSSVKSEGIHVNPPVKNYEINYIKSENDLMNIYKRTLTEFLRYNSDTSNSYESVTETDIILEFIRFKGEPNSNNAQIDNIFDRLVLLFNQLNNNNKHEYFYPIPMYKYNFNYNNNNKYIVFDDYLKYYDYLVINIYRNNDYIINVVNGLFENILKFQEISDSISSSNLSFIHGNIDKKFILVKKPNLNYGGNYSSVIFTGIYDSGHHSNLLIFEELRNVTKNPFLSYDTNEKLKKHDWFGIGIIILELISNKNIENHIYSCLENDETIKTDNKKFILFYKKFIYLFNELIQLINKGNNNLTDEVINSINYYYETETESLMNELLKNNIHNIWKLCINYKNIIDNSNYDVNLFSSNINEIRLDYNPNKIKKVYKLNFPTISSQTPIYKEDELPTDECSNIKNELDSIKKNKNNMFNEVRENLDICVKACTSKEIEELSKGNNINMNCPETCDKESKETENYKKYSSLIDNELDKQIELSNCKKKEPNSNGGKKRKTIKKSKRRRSQTKKYKKSKK